MKATMSQTGISLAFPGEAIEATSPLAPGDGWRSDAGPLLAGQETALQLITHTIDLLIACLIVPSGSLSP